MKFPTKDETFDGIINYITRKHKINLDKYIKTSNSSYQKDDVNWGDSNTLLDFSTTLTPESCFCSKNEPFSNVTFYFLKHQIYVKSYTITSRPWENVDMLKSWNIYGSNDMKEWTFIDSQGPTDDLLISQTRKTYYISTPGKFRFIRITQSGINSSGNDYFLLGKIDFFGELINEYCAHTSKHIINYKATCFIAILIFS